MVVQHMLSSERVRLRCRGTVLRIALLDRRLAVQLSDRVSIYQVLCMSWLPCLSQ